MKPEWKDAVWGAARCTEPRFFYADVRFSWHGIKSASSFTQTRPSRTSQRTANFFGGSLCLCASVVNAFPFFMDTQPWVVDIGGRKAAHAEKNYDNKSPS